MLLFRSKRIVKSEVAPGVEYVIRKMTDSRRAELTLSTSEINQRLTDAYNALRKLREDKAEPAVLRKAMIEVDTINDRELVPAQIKWAVAEVRGLMLEIEDGTEPVVATVDNISDWPTEVLDEVKSVVLKGNGLTEQETKN